MKKTENDKKDFILNIITNNIAKLKLFIENTSKYSFYSNALITINHLKRIEDDISQGLQGPPCTG